MEEYQSDKPCYSLMNKWPNKYQYIFQITIIKLLQISNSVYIFVFNHSLGNSRWPENPLEDPKEPLKDPEDPLEDPGHLLEKLGNI